MTSTPRMEMRVLDAADIERLAAFRAQLTGRPVVRRDPDWTTLRTPDGQELAWLRASPGSSRRRAGHALFARLAGWLESCLQPQVAERRDAVMASRRAC